VRMHQVFDSLTGFLAKRANGWHQCYDTHAPDFVYEHAEFLQVSSEVK
jgi:hypothetical protein